MNVKEININSIKIIENVRSQIKNLEGLMSDIKQHGLKQAIGVMPASDSGEFILVFGHRRLTACKKLGWKKIPANVYPKDMEIADLLVNNIAENIHREDVSPMEEGRICKKLKDMDMTISEIAVRLNIPATRVARSLDLINQVPAKHKNRIQFTGNGAKNGNISATVAGKIVSCSRQFGLSESARDKIYSTAKAQEYTAKEMYILGLFLAEGLSVTQAMESMKDYYFLETKVIVRKSELQSILEKYKMDSAPMLMQSIIYGLVPPMKKPDFYKIKQVPAKV